MEIVVMTICSVIAGCDVWEDIVDFCRVKEAWFKESLHLKLTNGLPSHDTMQRVWSMIDPSEFERCFRKWVSSVCGEEETEECEIISIDGKTLRRSGSREQSPVHMVSAWAIGSSWCWGSMLWRCFCMYLKRKIDTFLAEWKADSNRKPLIVRGSRQIGKTESVLHFAKDNYESIIEINFVRDVKYKGIISNGYEASDIIKNISLIDPTKKFIPGKTLIFFDEITEFREITTSLKFFCIDKRFDVICSGSMLGVNYKEIESNSVGYKKDYDMYSMDFEEFLWAKGYENAVMAG